MQIQQGIETLRNTAPSLVNTLGMGLPRPTSTSTTTTTGNTTSTSTASTTAPTATTNTTTTNSQTNNAFSEVIIISYPWECDLHILFVSVHG